MRAWRGDGVRADRDAPARISTEVPMQYDWIVDVLNDLRDFARSNGLSGLAGHLDDAVVLAGDEIAQARAEVGQVMPEPARDLDTILRRAARGKA